MLKKMLFLLAVRKKNDLLKQINVGNMHNFTPKCKHLLNEALKLNKKKMID